MGRTSDFTVFLIDDDPQILSAMTRLLRAASLKVVAFSSAAEFLASHDRSVPGCSIVDLSMGDFDGLQLQEKLLLDGVDRPIVFLTGNGDVPSSVRAMKNGAVDFLTKPFDRDRLFAAIACAAAADERSRTRHAEMKSINDRLATLTRREREVLQYVVAGRLNKQIAATLGTVEKTIKVHRGRMMTKMGVRSVADLVRLSEHAGILSNLSSPPSMQRWT
jgi:FixJ family two-component response regulator